MRLLLVKLRHIGDSLLLTPTVRAVKEAYPEAQIDVLVRAGTEGILKGCSDIRKIYITASPEKSKRSVWSFVDAIRLQAEVRSERYDVAVDLGNNDRGRTIVGLSGAKMRCANSYLYPIKWLWRQLLTDIGCSDWSVIHRVQADFLNVKDFIDLPQQEPGPLIFEKSCTSRPPISLVPGKPLVVFHPVTRWQRKRWTDAHWISLGKALIAQNYQLIISVGPDPEEIAQGERLTQGIGPECLSTAGKLHWRHLAWLLYEARVFVGVDTAAMHLAAATGCPTVALFGPDSNVGNWGPWKTPSQVVRFKSDEISALHEVESAVARFLALPTSASA